jgi:hypothetical protein
LADQREVSGNLFLGSIGNEYIRVHECIVSEVDQTRKVDLTYFQGEFLFICSRNWSAAQRPLLPTWI